MIFDRYSEELYDDITEEQETLYSVTELCKDVIRQLYSSDTIDYNALHKDIEELCHILHIKPREGNVTIERKKTKMAGTLESWVKLNNMYLQNLAI